MASIQKRPNGKWRARYRDHDGREHSRHFDRKIDAERWLAEVTAALVTGQYVSPDAGRITLGDYAAGWERNQVASPATLRINDNALRLHIVPELGKRQMRAIKRSDVQALVKTLEGKLAPGSVRNVYDVLVQVCDTAVLDRIITSSPCTRVTLPKRPDDEVTPPTVEQVDELVAGVDERFRGLVVLLVGSGLRIGEALGLRVDDVDFLRRTVRVSRQRLQDGTVAAPKTAKSVRTVPLDKLVVDELAAHLSAYPSGEWLFTDEAGEPVPYWRWKRVFAAAAKAAGATRLTSHDLRHFYASALIAGGSSVKQVQARLGHSSAAMTLDVYSGLWPDEEDHTRSVMSATLGRCRSLMRTECGHSTTDSDVIAGQKG